MHMHPHIAHELARAMHAASLESAASARRPVRFVPARRRLRLRERPVAAPVVTQTAPAAGGGGC
jgi:hypothetical protein